MAKPKLNVYGPVNSLSKPPVGVVGSFLVYSFSILSARHLRTKTRFSPLDFKSMPVDGSVEAKSSAAAL